MARPEAIRIRTRREGAAGTVEGLSYLGLSADYTVETELGPVPITDYEMQGGVLDTGTDRTPGVPAARGLSAARGLDVGEAAGSRCATLDCEVDTRQAFFLTHKGGSLRIRRIVAAFLFLGSANHG